LLAPETEERSFLEYLDVLRRRKYLVIAIVVVFIAASLGVDALRTKTYGATASMQLVSQNVAQGGGTVELSTTDIATDIELVSSAAVQEIVTTALHQPAPNVAVSEVGLTAVVNVSVSSANPDFAVRAANEYVAAYIKYTTDRFAQATKQEETALQSQQTTLNSEINAIEQQIANSKPSSSSNSGLNTELQVYAAQLEEVNTSLSQLQLDQAQVSSGGLTVSPASTASLTVSPKKKTDALLAALLGILIGIGLALLLEFLDDRIRTKDQLHVVSGRLPLLGEIPEFDNWKGHADTAIIAAERPKSAAAEAYRSLRTAIQFIGFDTERTNVIQITSPLESEGKTTTVIDLAVTMASSGARVVVVSCDLRRPGLHHYFKVPNFFGVSSVLAGVETVESVIVRSENFPSLSCLPSGPVPPNPSELLGSLRLAELFEELRATNDVILVDSPPVLPVTDAIVIAQVVDVVVLVARAGQTHARSVTRALELLSNVDAPVKGVILNAVEVDSSRRGHGRYGAYGRYGGYGNYGSYA
jgi:capsular exopolysaccharide synthesis family protein